MMHVLFHRSIFLFLAPAIGLLTSCGGIEYERKIHTYEEFKIVSPPESETGILPYTGVMLMSICQHEGGCIEKILDHSLYERSKPASDLIGRNRNEDVCVYKQESVMLGQNGFIEFEFNKPLRTNDSIEVHVLHGHTCHHVNFFEVYGKRNGEYVFLCKNSSSTRCYLP